MKNKFGKKQVQLGNHIQRNEETELQSEVDEWLSVCKQHNTSIIKIIPGI